MVKLFDELKRRNVNLREIGDILEVAHILEGSVRKSGDNIRVTAQLAKAKDGFHLFSKNYDRKLDDIFKVQDDIAREANAGEQEDWVAAQIPEPALYGAPHFTNLAFALRQLERDAEADRFLARAAETLAVHERHGADNFWFWINSAEYAALSGDPDRMIGFLQRALDAGYAAEFGFLPATLDSYRGEPRFIKLENEVIRRANEERRKLGLVAPTNSAT